MHKFIEVISLSAFTYRDEVYEDVELINVDNIAIITSSGNIVLKRGYPNGDNVCKTKHTYEELKQMLSDVIIY